MELLCPEIERLVACRLCGSQTLPPYRLCWNAHIGCLPCVEYLSRCTCGETFYEGRHSTFDCVVSAMKLKCKYRSVIGGGARIRQVASMELMASGDGPQGECDASRWYDVTELREHYRTGCSMNAYTCQLDGCGGYQGRVDTIVDHYESIHGPFEQLTPDNPLRPQIVTFRIPPSDTKTVRKIFNGYFLVNVTYSRRWIQGTSTRQFIQNINPADPLRYKYEATVGSPFDDIVFSVSLLNRLEYFI